MPLNSLIHSLPKKYSFILKLKFLFLMIKLILVICVYLTYDENLFSGLSMMEARDSDIYLKARATLLSSITLFAIFALVELGIAMLGFTYNWNKNNIIVLSLNIFAVYLIIYFMFDSWHYITFWYIFIVAQVPQTALEVSGFVYSIVNDLLKYRKMKSLSLKKEA